MKRPVITADSITVAHKQGERALSVPYAAVITPAAYDTAKALGVTITREAAPACSAALPASGRKVSSNRQGNNSAVQESPPPNKVFGIASDITSGTATGTAPGTASGQPDSRELPGLTPQLFDDIKQRVLAHLPTALRTHPLLDELLQKRLTAIYAKGNGPASTPQASPGSARQDDASAPVPKEPWKVQAGKALCVRSADLPWQASPLSGAVNVIDVVGGKSCPFEAGFFEWENASFTWTLERDEVFTVLSGEMRVRVAGESLHAAAGDMVYLPKGSEAEFSSSSLVKTAYTACAPSCAEGMGR